MMENYTQRYICFNKQQNAEKYIFLYAWMLPSAWV